MWKTADGFVLTAPPQAGLGKRGRDTAPSSPAHLAASRRLLAAAVRGSRLAGLWGSPSTGREFQVFRTPGINGVPLLLYADPVKGAYGEILAVREASPELMEEISRRRPYVRATISWSPSKPLASLRGGTGVYIVERGGKPIYVGITADDFARRWSTRMLTLRQLGIDAGIFGIRLGDVKWNDPGDTRTVLQKLMDVEHALIRNITRQGHTLNNTTSILKFFVDPNRTLSIRNAGSRPAYLSAHINPSPGSSVPYELAWN